MTTKTINLTNNWLKGMHGLSARKRRKLRINYTHRRTRNLGARNQGKAGAI